MVLCQRVFTNDAYCYDRAGKNVVAKKRESLRSANSLAFKYLADVDSVHQIVLCGGKKKKKASDRCKLELEKGN